jgi:branched-subunit amino acid transport protein
VNMWILMVAIGVGTYLLRVSMLLALAGGRRLGRWADRPLQLVAPAALAALVITLLVGGAEPVDPADAVAVVAGFLAVRRSRNVLHAFSVGVPASLLLGIAFDHLPS